MGCSKGNFRSRTLLIKQFDESSNVFENCSEAKYKRMIELDNTMPFVYANPEPMLKIKRLEVDNSSNEIK